jgi:hypothetical protein
MSRYLLLRNNKETGPYTLDDLTGLSLKAYDLIWVEGKSAAWRYPCEIPELKSFAPEVEEQPFDRFFKKPLEENRMSKLAEPAGKLSSDPIPLASRPEEPLKSKPGKSVYINLPAAGKSERNAVQPLTVPEKSAPVAFRNYLPVDENVILPPPVSEPAIIKPQPERNRALVITGFLILFGIGILTGYILSNRGNSSSIKMDSSAVVVKTVQPVQQTSLAVKPPVAEKQEIIPDKNSNEKIVGDQPEKNNEKIVSDQPEKTIPEKKSTVAAQPKTKKDRKPAPVTDSISKNQQPPVQVQEKKVSVETAVNDNIENYVTAAANKYVVGTFGGISNLKLTITNDAAVPLDLVVVEVQYIQSNKKVFKTENIYFHNIVAGSSLAQDAPASPRGIKIRYRISMINAKQVNFSFSDM